MFTDRMTCQAAGLALTLLLASQSWLGPGHASEAAKRSADWPLADFTFTLAQGKHSRQFAFQTADAGEIVVLVRGLSLGGAVHAALNDQGCDNVEPFSTGGASQGKADTARVTVAAAADCWVRLEAVGGQSTNLSSERDARAEGRRSLRRSPGQPAAVVPESESSPMPPGFRPSPVPRRSRGSLD